MNDLICRIRRALRLGLGIGLLHAVFAVSAFFHQGEELTQKWHTLPDQTFQQEILPDRLRAVIRPGGALVWENPDLEASEIGKLEFLLKGSDFANVLHLEWIAEENGIQHSGRLGAVWYPDGDFHVVSFEVNKFGDWRGTIRRLSLSFLDDCTPNGTLTLELAAVRALPVCNLVDNADRALVSPDAREGSGRLAGGRAVFQLETLPPRGIVSVSGLTGDSTLEFLDTAKRPIGKIALADQERFEVPALTVYGVLDVPEATAPLLEVVEIPPLVKRSQWFRGSWIWASTGMEPFGPVWFQREFDLEELPLQAKLMVGADDGCKVWINGAAADLETSDWVRPGLADVAGLLRPGRNVISIRVVNDAVWGGLIAELCYISGDGRENWVVSDGQWTKLERGGAAPPAPEAITESVSVLGVPPQMPWGDQIPYRFPGLRTELQTVDGGEVFHAGGGWGVRQQLRLTRPLLTEVHSVAGRLESAEGLPERSSVEFSVSPDSSEWPLNTPFTVEFRAGNEAFAGLRSRCMSVAVDDSALAFDRGWQLEVKVPAGIGGSGKLAHAEIVNPGTRPFVKVDGEYIAPFFFYMPPGLDLIERVNQIRTAAASGSRMIRVGLSLRDFWTGEGAYDFEKADKVLEMVAAHCPGAYIGIMLFADAPEWWCLANPDECVRYSDPALPVVYSREERQSLFSARWRDDVCGGIRAFADHIRQSSYSDRIVTFFTDAGPGAEWWVNSRQSGIWQDYDGFGAAALRRYREWLGAKYATDEALRRAWNQPDVTLATALPPLPWQRYMDRVGTLLDPAQDMGIVDHRLFTAEVMSSTVEGFARAVKEASDGGWLTGSYYGYINMFSHMFHLLQNSGHMDMAAVLKSDAIDFFSAPTEYPYRRPGMANHVMQAAGSVSAHGKTLNLEFDNRTFSSNSPDLACAEVRTVRDSIEVLNRDFGMALALGAGGHWYDMTGVWFQEPVMLDAIRRQIAAYQSLPRDTQGLTPCDAAWITDEKSTLYTKTNLHDALHRGLIGEVGARINEAGFAFRQLDVSDLLSGAAPEPHRFYIVSNLLSISRADAERLRERFEREKASVLWIYAPGIIDPAAAVISPDNVLRNFGWEVKVDAGPARPGAMQMIAEYGGAVERLNYPTSPWIEPVPAAGDRVIAWDLQAPERPAMLERRMADGRIEWFCMLPNPSPGLLRSLARQIPVHLWSETGDPLHIGNDTLTIHAKTGGVKELRIPAGTRLRQLLGALPQEYVQAGGTFSMSPGETIVFLLEKR